MEEYKRVAKGLRSDRLGDVDLWGHKAKPTLQDKLDKLKEDMERIKTIIDDIPDYDNMDIYTSLRSLLRMIMLKIQDIRQIELKERRRLMNYDKLNPDPNFRAAAKSACKAQIYECKIFVHKALQLNLEICECLAKMQNNYSVMMTQNINLSTQFNVRRLLSVEYVSKYIDISWKSTFNKTRKWPVEAISQRKSHYWKYCIQCTGIQGIQQSEGTL